MSKAAQLSQSYSSPLVFIDTAAIAASRPSLGRVLELVSGSRYEVGAADLGSGISTANGLFANILPSEAIISTFTTSGLVGGTISGAATGDVTTTTGFAAAGDGGGADWVKTGNTIAVSNTPSQTGNSTCSDSLGFEYSLVINDSVYPEQLGAVGDGTTDDTLVINAAFSGGNKIVSGKQGSTYLVTGRVDIFSNTVFQANNCIVKYGSMAGVGLISESTSNVKIFNLEINGDKLSYSPVDAFGLYLKTVDNFEVAGCNIHDVFRIGVFCGHVTTGQSTNGFIHDNLIKDIGDNREATQYGNGIAVTHGKIIHIHNNTIDNIYGTGGINLEGDTYSDITISDNTVTNGTGSNLRGIMQFESGAEVHDNIIITGNIVTGLPGAGITLSGDGKRTISNNIVTSCGEEGIKNFSSASSEMIINNNQVDSCGSLGFPCFNVATSLNLTCIGNQINNCPAGSTIGMALTNTGSASITGNSVNGSQTNAYELGCSGFSFTGNVANNIGVVNSGSNYFLKNRTGFACSDGVISNNTLKTTGGASVAMWLINGSNWVNIEESNNRSNIAKYSISAASNSNVRNIQAPNAPDLGSVFGNTAAWGLGDILYDSTPTSAGQIGWVCTVAGTPGTWKAFGTIA